MTAVRSGTSVVTMSELLQTLLSSPGLYVGAQAAPHDDQTPGVRDVGDLRLVK